MKKEPSDKFSLNELRPVKEKLNKTFANGLKITLGGVVFTLMVNGYGCIAGARPAPRIETQQKTTEPTTQPTPDAPRLAGVPVSQASEYTTTQSVSTKPTLKQRCRDFSSYRPAGLVSSSKPIYKPSTTQSVSKPVQNERK
jgi:hypothetical protein